MISMKLPTRHDPIARVSLLAVFGLALFANVYRFQQAQPAAAQDIIIAATATPALPTPALGELPVALPSIPTPQPLSSAEPPAPFPIAPVEVAAPAPQSAAVPEVAPVDNSAYLANVGDQAAHSPRGNVSEPPPAQTGPVAQPDGSIIVPAESAPAPDPAAMAVAVPHISEAQAVVIGARESDTCIPPAIFYPRTGCHVPGSGGPQPGAVGEGQP